MRARIDTPLRRILREEGRRQDWLADQVGADVYQVSRWVRGVHVPVEATREAIACALGRHVDEIFPGESMAEAA